MSRALAFFKREIRCFDRANDFTPEIEKSHEKRLETIPTISLNRPRRRPQLSRSSFRPCYVSIYIDGTYRVTTTHSTGHRQNDGAVELTRVSLSARVRSLVCSGDIVSIALTNEIVTSEEIIRNRRPPIVISNVDQSKPKFKSFDFSVAYYFENNYYSERIKIRL